MAEQALFAALNRFPTSWKKKSGQKSRATFQIEFGFSISFGGNLMTFLNADSEKMTNKHTILKCQTWCASSRGRFPATFCNWLILTVITSSQEIAECFDTCIVKLFKAMDRHLKRGLPVHVSHASSPTRLCR